MGNSSIAIYLLSTAITFGQLYFFFSLQARLVGGAEGVGVGTQLCLIGPCGPGLFFFFLFNFSSALDKEWSLKEKKLKYILLIEGLRHGDKSV